MIAIDIECYDANLSTLGDGSMRKDGFILCIGLYDGKDYVNCTPDDPRLVDWLASDEDKIFHNSVYDLSWLCCGYGWRVGGILHDTMTRAALINEYEELGLDACCKRFKVEGKNAGDTIEEWFNSVKKQWDLRGDVWDNADVVWMHPEGKKQMIAYNKQDCIATYNLFMAQEKLMGPHRNSYQVECESQPVIIMMKQNGIRMDLVRTEQFTQEIEGKLKEIEKQLSIVYGITNEIIASPKKMTFAMNQLGIHSPVHTDTGAESWAAGALELIDHDVIPLIAESKVYSALISKYLRGSLAKCRIGDRVHCTFSPNKREKGGTITGRYSSSKPNMQNIPAREEKTAGAKAYGQEMRALFIPEEGHLMLADDYSQIEYLLLAHYAQGSQAEWFREQANAGVDFHTVAMQMTGITVRDQVKRMNYGIIYGMGANKMYSINRKTFHTLENTRKVFAQYHARLPVVRDTMTWAQNIAKQQGYIASIGGRIHHKPRPMLIDGKWNDMIYKMTNYLIQGSAAEILKKGLLDAYKAGVFNVLKLHATIHDENVCSMPYTKEGVEAALELERCMNGAYHERLLVPMKVACEVGDSWGYWESDVWEALKKGDFDTHRRLVA